jgi:tungstate transport system substrate-binding protein
MFRNRKTAFICGLIMMLAFTFPSLAAENCTEVYGSGNTVVGLATGSPGELGLVKVLAQEFDKEYPVRLCWRKAGSGASLKLLKAKDVDLVMVHAPAAEKQAVAEGWAVRRSLIGSNEFYIVGPKDDPAGISQAAGAAEAYQRIAAVKAPFLSRGDNSGTHKKEMAIWQKAGIQPAGDWYIVTKTFMMATLKQADEEKGYFMTDSSTWVSAKKDLKNLKILFRGDPFLINTYHALCQPKGATPGQEYAAKFIDFLVSEEGQKIIGAYGMDAYGEGLYNDAAYARQFDH